MLVKLVEAGASADVVAAHVTPSYFKHRLKDGALDVVLNAMYNKVIPAEAKIEYLHLVGETKAAPILPLGEWARRVKNFITLESSKAIVAITNTTRQKVRKVLKESAAAGEGIAETAKNMRTSITQFSNVRAKRIARTELLGALNTGSLIGAQTTGLKLDKVWLASVDGRTRESHIEANGQRVDINADFVVGGVPCQYPAAPTLSARERINCRCTQIYKPKPRLVQTVLDL